MAQLGMRAKNQIDFELNFQTCLVLIKSIISLQCQTIDKWIIESLIVSVQNF